MGLQLATGIVVDSTALLARSVIDSRHVGSQLAARWDSTDTLSQW